MTKERKAAIRQWEYIVGQLMQGRPFTTEMKKASTPYEWKHGCWFCQYVRKDYRESLKSRKYIPYNSNRCTKCPLYKYIVSMLRKKGKAIPKNMCGCDVDNDYSLFGQVVRFNSIEAAKKILAMLKGEKLWLE